MNLDSHPRQPQRQKDGRVRGRAVVVIASALILTGSSCTSDTGDSRSVVTVGVFGDFGYQDLYRKYEAEHPDVKIVERVSAYEDHHHALATHLATGRGANDIEAIETGYIARFKAQPQHFVDFLDHGAGSKADQWLPWKWQQSLSADGAGQIGLGTDVGGLAMCYRRDLFTRAGLPSDRDAVSRLWPDWKSYFAVGKRFLAASDESKWFDSGGSVFNAIMGQARVGYYRSADELVVESNPAVRSAWDQVTSAVLAGESAGLTPVTRDWDIGFQKDRFATVTCPAWMMGYIQDQAKASAGQWDVAAVPGGGGNWGGSFLTVPKQGEHTAEAVALANWLTAPEQQAYVFRQTGNLPSTPSLYDDPSVSEFTKPFFNNAPVGKIFTTAASELRPRYEGPKEGDIWLAFSRALNRVEQGKHTPDKSWEQVLDDVRRIAE